MEHIMLDHVGKTYNPGRPEEKVALKNISLNIQKGEACALTGASGSGKSTLLNIIGLLDVPSQGNLEIDGRKTEKMADKQRAQMRNQNIGFVFQSFGLIEDRSALENVLTPFLFDRETSLRKGKRMAMEALEKVGLSGMARKRVTRLSGGERQRVAIARAIVRQHEIILADEPTGQLDSATAASIMELLMELNAQGATLVVVTHNTEVAAYCPRQITLKDGEILSDEKRI
ncbi:MAG TPA: ABC transporter ATP-binding protein [Candidatus Faecaligallichristensenella faecipullorum]|nr:ABC transporter ATP-binding protein [Candidatus Faecaligallichristensenella faecipullorum]